MIVIMLYEKARWSGVRPYINKVEKDPNDSQASRQLDGVDQVKATVSNKIGEGYEEGRKKLGRKD